MLVLEHIRQLVKACNPADRDEYAQLWGNIKPVKFGNVINWNAANQYTLASYQVPRDTFNVVLRVECYTVNLNSGAADYGAFEPPPPGTAYWSYVPAGGTGLVSYNETSTLMNSHLLCDADEFLLFQGGYDIALIGDFLVSPDATIRKVRTLVYSYNCGAEVVDRIGAGKILIT